MTAPAASPASSYGKGLGAGIVFCVLGAMLSIIAFFVFLMVNLEDPPAWIFVLMAMPVPLIVAAVVLAILRGRRVRAALAAFAASRGWTWSPRPTAQHEARAAPFRLSKAPGPMGVVEGKWEGMPFLAATIRIGQGRQAGSADAILVPMPVSSPGLALVPQALGRLAKMSNPISSLEDIGFESDAFSRAYWVSARDRRFAYEVLHPAMLEALLAHRPQGALAWEGRVMAITFTGDKLANEMTWEAIMATLPIVASLRRLLPRTLAGLSGPTPATAPGTRHSP